jgi:hypothetical protein
MSSLSNRLVLLLGACCCLDSGRGIDALSRWQPLQLGICLEEGDEDPAPPLCHKIQPVTVANCANASSTCVTAITPTHVCNLVIRSGEPKCRCVLPVP